MNWLLDVNALIALAHQGHADHSRVIRWFASLIGSNARLGTCSITEIGFVRVSIQAGFENNAPEAVDTLIGLKESSRIPFDLIPDSLGADRLPSYVSAVKQVTDGHLLALAADASMRLATLDKGIPGAYVIPRRR
ncbi:MAG: VapC toxin family PIN domain ribonuclease [Verrucomicrobiales bacterium]|nr:VapC toxin family PIN domain ribonuclease [Verrucomicrobiales bacterium]